MKKKFEYTEPEIINYDTDHLDDLVGHVSDYTYEARQVPAKTQQNFLPARPAQTRQRGPVDLSAVTTIATAGEVINVDAGVMALEGAREVTSGMDRSKALIIRLVPFSVVWLILAIGVSWAASMGGWFTLLLFSGLTAVTYAYLDRQEYQFSRNGLERHKVNTLADLKRDQMSHEQELKRMALEATIRMLEARNSDDY